MQMLAHITINGEKIRVLVRQSRTSRHIRLRYGGLFDTHLTDESERIALMTERERNEFAERLWRGETIEF